jgi:hypothetical protein
MLRRHLWRWLTVAMLASVATAASAGAPATASATIYCFAAPCPQECPQFRATNDALLGGDCLPAGYRTAPVTHKGWTYLNLNYCPPSRACAAIYQVSMPAWSWTGTSWRQSTLKGGWVYVYPYTGQWRWAWTQQSGWVAVNSGRFEIRPY